MPIDDAAADGGEYDLTDPGPSGFGEGIPAAAPADTTPASTPPEGAAPAAGTESGQQVTDATAAGAAPSGEQQAAAGGTQQVTAPVQLTPELMQRAAMVGVDPSQLSAFADPVGAIVMAENVAMKTLIQAAQFQQQQQNQQRQAQAPRPQPPQPPAPFNEVALRKQYADAGYDSQQIDLQIQALQQNHNMLVGQYQLAMRDHQLQEQLWQSNQTTQALQAQMAQQQQAHQADLINRDFADFKKTIDPNVAKLIGQNEQRAIMAQCDVTYRGMMAAGVQPPDNHKMFEQAMYATLGPKIFGAAREVVRGEVQTHQDRSIARPTSAALAKLPLGEDRAARFAEDFWSRAGRQAVGTDGGSLEV